MKLFARGLYTQLNVIYALILRETKTRFGKHQVGYLWALFEPLSMIGTFLILFNISGRQAPNGMDLPGFLATGMIPYTLFKSTATRTMLAISGNKALLFYPQVTPLDLIFARFTLELVTLLTVFIIIMGVNALYLEELKIDNLFMVIEGLGLAAIFGSAFGMVLCGLNQFSEAVERLVGTLMRPLFWTSGLFFTANQLPTNIRNKMAFNPVLHVIELVRDGWYSSYSSRIAHPGYLWYWIIASAFIGLLLERVSRRQMEVV